MCYLKKKKSHNAAMIETQVQTRVFEHSSLWHQNCLRQEWLLHWLNADVGYERFWCKQDWCSQHPPLKTASWIKNKKEVRNVVWETAVNEKQNFNGWM